MSRRDKLIRRIVQCPAEASLDDVRAIPELFGWEHASTRGSQARFRKPGERSITVSVHNGKVKRVYLEEICERLGLDDETGTF